MANAFDITALTLLILLSLNGIRKGLSDELMKLISVLLAIYITLNFHQFGTSLLLKFWEIPEQYQALLGFTAVFLAMILFMQLITIIVKQLIKALSLGWLDRIGGLLFGGLKALVLLAVILWVTELLPPTWLGSWYQDSKAFPAISGFQQGMVTMLNLDEEVAVIQAKVAGFINTPPSLQDIVPGQLPVDFPDLIDSTRIP